MAITPDINSNNVKFDLEPFIKEAMERINVEIDARVAALAAVEMRKLGWVCIPPPPEEPLWCTHEAWEAHGGGRRCADCKQYLTEGEQT